MEKFFNYILRECYRGITMPPKTIVTKDQAEIMQIIQKSEEISQNELAKETSKELVKIARVVLELVE